MSDGNAPPSNVGTYLARRLINIGIREFYAVPGTFECVVASGGVNLEEACAERRGGLMSRKRGMEQEERKMLRKDAWRGHSYYQCISFLLIFLDQVTTTCSSWTSS